MEFGQAGRYWWVILGAAIIGASVVKPITSEVVQKLLSNDRDRAEYDVIEKQVQSALPMKVDDVTTAVEFKIDRDAATYRYEVSSTVDKFDPDIVRQTQMSLICGAWKKLLINGFTSKVIYTYDHKNTQSYFEVSAADCMKF